MTLVTGVRLTLMACCLSGYFTDKMVMVSLAYELGTFFILELLGGDLYLTIGHFGVME